LIGAIGLQVAFERNWNCMPDLLTNQYPAPSYMLVLSPNLTVVRSWNNFLDGVDKMYGPIISGSRDVVTRTLKANASFPANGFFLCPKIGWSIVRVTALKFDAPEGNYTYYIGTGQKSILIEKFEHSLMNLMGSDLTKFYQISIGVYLICYLLALFLIE
jgi:hypothetical protein